MCIYRGVAYTNTKWANPSNPSQAYGLEGTASAGPQLTGTMARGSPSAQLDGPLIGHSLGALSPSRRDRGFNFRLHRKYL